MKVTQDIVLNGPVYADVPRPAFKPGPAEPDPRRLLDPVGNESRRS